MRNKIGSRKGCAVYGVLKFLDWSDRREESI